MLEKIIGFTPENLNYLMPNEIFVFGSNRQGKHYSGAAKIANDKFGAKFGQGYGAQGQSFAIATVDFSTPQREKVSIEHIIFQIHQLFHYATENSNQVFYLTAIGTGIAGFTIQEIADVLIDLTIPMNLRLPMSFLSHLESTAKHFVLNLEDLSYCFSS